MGEAICEQRKAYKQVHECVCGQCDTKMYNNGTQKKPENPYT